MSRRSRSAIQINSEEGQPHERVCHRFGSDAGYSWVKEYAAKTEAIVTRHGGRYLVRGATMEKLEGAAPLPT